MTFTQSTTQARELYFSASLATAHSISLAKLAKTSRPTVRKLFSGRRNPAHFFLE
jgi:hypothetical protein